MRILVSTFREGDFDKLTLAMRRLPYDKLAIIGSGLNGESPSLEAVRKLEEMAGHEVEVSDLDEEDLLTLVDQVSSTLERLGLDTQTNTRNSLALNISGGSKLLGDAALLAAFRLGIEAYHCENRVTKLPIIKGATARDRFTQMQLSLIKAIGRREVRFDEMGRLMQSESKQSTDRLVRELKKQGIIESESRSGIVFVHLSGMGREVLAAVTISERAGLS